MATTTVATAKVTVSITHEVPLVDHDVINTFVEDLARAYEVVPSLTMLTFEPHGPPGTYRGQFSAQGPRRITEDMHVDAGVLYLSPTSQGDWTFEELAAIRTIRSHIYTLFLSHGLTAIDVEWT